MDNWSNSDESNIVDDINEMMNEIEQNIGFEPKPYPDFREIDGEIVTGIFDPKQDEFIPYKDMRDM